MKSIYQFIFVMLLALGLASCGDDDKGGAGSPYDPDQPVTLESFYPDSGGMATRVIMSGSNFGNDAKNIKVYFNKTRASVVSANHGRLYVITPRQPGETCNVSVVVGSDSSTYPQTFRYRISTTVTTVVGQKGTSAFKGGTLAEATFHNPSFLTIDNENNIFLSHWGTPYNFVIINQEKNFVQELAATGAANVPGLDATGKIVMVPTDNGYNFYQFDADAQWAAKRMTIQRPTTDEQNNMGMRDFTINYKHCFTSNALDGMIYTRSYNGHLIKFNPQTRKGQLVADNIMPDSDSYLIFHPQQQNVLYITYPNRSVIYTYNLDTGEHLLYAGTLNKHGWKDGNRLEAEFSSPRQLVFDVDGSIVIADENNHCIRRISPEGVVTTVIGMGGKSGYVDGNPDMALFNRPRGVCIDKEFNIYIADYGNNCIRKLAVE